jgi:Fe-S cluster biogenesis protein NfuA
MRGIVRNEPITLPAEKRYPVQMTLSPPDRASVEAVLEALRPSIKADGGDVELVNITDDGIVRVRLLGACVGCPSSQMTLRGGIEANLVGRVPGVTGVEAVEAA